MPDQIPMTDLALLDSILSESPIVIQKPFFRVTKDLKSAIFLSQIYYWSKKMNHDWFYKTMEELQAETFLSIDEQKRIRKHLRNLGVIEEKLRKMPPKLHFKFNFHRFIELAKIDYSQLEGKPLIEETQENSQLEGLPLNGKAPNQLGGLPLIINEHKTTTEDYKKKNTKKKISAPSVDKLALAAWKIAREASGNAGKAGKTKFEDALIQDVVKKIGGWSTLGAATNYDLNMTLKPSFIETYLELAACT